MKHTRRYVESFGLIIQQTVIYCQFRMTSASGKALAAIELSLEAFADPLWVHPTGRPGMINGNSPKLCDDDK